MTKVRRKQWYLWVFLAAVIWLFIRPVGLHGQGDQDVEVRASISADKIGTDDVLIYTVTFKGINNPTQPDVSHFKDFRAAQTSRSSEFQFVNGVSSYYTNFMYYLVPLRMGHLTLPPVTYQYEGKEYKTQPFIVEVVKGSIAPAAPQQRQRRLPFLDEDDPFSGSPFQRQRQPQEIDIKVIPEVSTKNVMVGQQVIFRVLLYTRNRIQSVNMLSNQSFPGFWQEWFPTPRSIDSQTKVVSGRAYQVYEVRKAALFPTTSGTITIPSLDFEIGMVDMDAFSVFSGTRPVTRSTPELTLQVSPLPPEAVGLPVGNFQLNVAANKSEVDINDILTLKVSITGSGNIKTLNVPEFKNTDFFKIYPAKISRDVTYQENNITGYVEAEVPVSFKKTGLISFPPLEFRYYDPETAKVAVLKNSPIMINVTGKKEKETSAQTLPESEIIKTGEDIDFIKTGDVYNQDNNLYKKEYYKILLLIPFLVNLLFLLKILLFDRFISQSSLLKQKKLIGRTIKSLANARDYGNISPVLENYLKEKAGLGLSGINNHSIGQVLGEHGVQEEDIKRLIQFKTQSESYRFSPGHISKSLDEDLKHDVKVLIEILKRIDSKIK